MTDAPEIEPQRPVPGAGACARARGPDRPRPERRRSSSSCYWLYPEHGVLIGLLLVIAVFSLLEASGGQTPGKRLLGLEVRYLDGTPCDAARGGDPQRSSASSTGSPAST